MNDSSLRPVVEKAVAETVPCLTDPPWQNQDGGIGRSPGVPSDLWSTAEALIIADRAQNMNLVPALAVTQMRGYVMDCKHPNSGWAADGASDPDVVGTTLALTALRRWRDDHEVREAAGNAIAWLAKEQNRDGGWDVTPARSPSDVVSTTYPTVHAFEAIAVWFLDNLGPPGLAQQALSNAHDWLTAVRGSRDGIGVSMKSPAPTPRHTAYALLVDYSAGDLGLPRRDMVKWLKRHQYRDGAWGTGDSEPQSMVIESTAAAVRALLASGVSPSSKRVRAAIEWLLDRRVEKHINGRRISGWPPRISDAPASWTTFYSLMALCDYLDATAKGQTRKKTKILFPLWRRVVSAALLLVLATAIVSMLVVTQANRDVVALITVLAAIANVLVAFPLVRSWFRRGE